jgi:hypothetical protein
MVMPLQSDMAPRHSDTMEIADLAYDLWQGRGCPTGSPDEDWFHAIEELRSHARER